MRRLFSLAGTIVALCAIMTSHAAADGWRATQVTGEVRVEIGNAAALPLTSMMTIAGDALIETAASGSATLVRGDDKILVAPNSRLRLPANESTGMTRVIEELGSLFFQVGKRSEPHFRVETPLLAATVKGTSFTVVVNDDGTDVQVREGLVMVQSNASADTTYVAAGRAASVVTAQPMDLYLDKNIVPPAALRMGDNRTRGTNAVKLVSTPRSATSRNGPSATGNSQAAEIVLTNVMSRHANHAPGSIALDSTLSGIGFGIFAAALAIGLIGANRRRPGLVETKAKRLAPAHKER